MKDLFPTFVLSLFTFAISLGLTFIISNLWLQIIVGGLAGMVFYFGMAYLTHMDQLDDIKYMFKR